MDRTMFARNKIKRNYIGMFIFLIIWGILAIYATCAQLYSGVVIYGGKGVSNKSSIFKDKDPIKFYLIAMAPSILGLMSLGLGVYLIKLKMNINKSAQQGDAPETGSSE